MNKLVLIAVLSITLISCSKDASFGDVINSSSINPDNSGSNDDVVIRIEDPKKEAEEKPEEKPEQKPEEKPEKKPEEKPEKKPEEKPEKKPEEKPEKKPEEKPEKKPEEKPEKKPEEKPEDKPRGDDISNVACKVDVKVTSAGNVSHHKGDKKSEPSLFDIHLRNSEAINELKAKLSEAEAKYINDAIEGSVEVSSGFAQTRVSDDIKLAFKESGKVRATSVHTDSIIIYGDSDLDIQFTSVKAKRLIIIAKGSVKLKTTSFDVTHAVVLVEQDDDKEQNICVRETSAGSFDITLDAPENGSGLIISGGTSFKNTKIESTILGDGSASQKWKATSIKDSEFLISNQVSSKSESSLKFTSVRDSKIKIDELSSEASVSIAGTAVKSSELQVENFSVGGTQLKTKIAHCGDDYRDGDIFLAFSGALEDIGASCK